MVNPSKIGNVLKDVNKKDGVYLVTQLESDNGFEADYIALRKKEQRLYTDNIVKQLPDGKQTSQPNEWEMRSRSAKRVMGYFKQKQQSRILDLGCGNGWFTAMLANFCNCEVVGVDLNLTELNQAARVFDKPNLHFVFSDIFGWTKTNGLFDFVTINAAIQYFPNFGKLIERLFSILKEGGEVHIIDSPFYKQEDVENAKIRSRKYYSELGFENMADNYFHHIINKLDQFDFEIMYQPRKRTFVNKIFKVKEIPFPWVKIKKG